MYCNYFSESYSAIDNIDLLHMAHIFVRYLLI